MEQELVGREVELEDLNKYLNSEKSEFIAVYGRRRVGKTFLIRKAVKDHFAFFMTGMHGVGKSEQLVNFSIALQKYTHSATLQTFKSWLLAFYGLEQYLESLPHGKKVIFIDELPWMDTAKSGFIPALENFWNSWAVLRNDIKLIVCGSATSWMINNLIRNRGGLHNRLTHHLVLKPFTLHECEEYFQTYHFGYSRKQIAECYMVMGGIPYYLSMMDKSKSLAQNIDQLFFAENAELKGEFDELYRALFKKSTDHIAVVTTLANKGIGMTRQELVKSSGLTDNGAFSTVLEELEQCGFIRLYEPFSTSTRMSGDSRQKRNTLFQLIDFYTLFYFKFIKHNKYQDSHFWSSSQNTPMHHTWIGLSFEMLCLNHIESIKQSLGISGVQTIVCSWRSNKTEKGAQIDLLIDRKDETINLCEIKFYNGPFEISKEYEEKLQNKISTFLEETKTKKSLILTFITSFGIKENKHSDIVQKQITMDDLFAQKYDNTNKGFSEIANH